MFKLIIPTLTIALLCNSISIAQYFGTKYPSSSSSMQPMRPIRIARATDTDPLSSPSDKLDAPETLNALDVPGSNDLQLPATKPLDRIAPPDQPQSLDVPGVLDPLALPDMPERLELPKPADSVQATVPEPSRNVQPEISASDFDSLEPINPLQSIVELAPTPVLLLPGRIDSSEAIQPQLRNFSQAAQQPVAARDDTPARFHSEICHGESAGICGTGQATVPYQTPILPPPNSFHGHFRSNSCYFDLWANYPAEAAAACAHNRAKLAPARPVECWTCD